MSNLFATLNYSVSSLQAQSRALSTTNKNVANMSSTSYSREVVAFGGDASGVSTTIEQSRDALLEQQVLRETGLTSYYETEQEAYQRAESALGETISSSDSSGTTETGISTALDDFFSSFQSLAASPTDVAERQTVIEQASILSDTLNLVDTRLTQVQSDLDSQIATDASQANDYLATVADLNDQIAAIEINNAGAATDLRNQRAAVLSKLSELLPVEVTELDNGTVQVSLSDTSGGEVLLVDNIAVNGAVAFDGTNVTAGNPATTVALTSGSIQGALAARDGAIQTLRDNLDTLVGQLVDAVNGAYGSDFFSGNDAGSIALASGITVTSLTTGSSGAAGANDIALAIGNLANTEFSTGSGDAIDGTIGDFYASVVSQFGVAITSVDTHVETQTSVEALVRTQRDSISGVDLDEEMADLLKFQRAFQASSRVFTAVDELIDNVVNTMGR